MSPCFHRPWCWTAAVGALCGHHPPGHADAAAVAGEVFAQARSSSSGTNPVGQRLAGQAEDRRGGVRAGGLDSAQGAGGGLGERHCRRVRLILALLDREAGRPVQPELHVPPGQCCGFRSPQTATGHHSDDCQVNGGPGLGDGHRFHVPPRPRRGSRAVSRMRARASAVRALACLGAGA